MVFNSGCFKKSICDKIYKLDQNESISALKTKCWTRKQFECSTGESKFMSRVNYITKTAILASLYAVITWAFYFVGYNAVQFRISEILVLLAFIDKRYIPGLVLGCVIANSLSPFGIIDVVVGSFASLFVVVMIAITRKMLGNNKISLFVASLWASVSSFIIAYEIVFIFGAPENFWYWTAMVAIGQFVVVSLVGFPIFVWILNNDSFVKRLSFDHKFFYSSK